MRDRSTGLVAHPHPTNGVRWMNPLLPNLSTHLRGHTMLKLKARPTLAAKPKLKPKLRVVRDEDQEDDDKSGGSYFLNQTAVEFIPSGCSLFDCALGGGWALGRVINLVGDKSTGKTLCAIELCCNFVAKFPTMGKIRYLEPEASFDKSYASALGLPEERVDFAPDTIDTVEDMFEDVEKFINDLGDDEPGIYIVDSLDALSSKAEKGRKITEGSYGDGKAKKMSEIFRRIKGQLKRKRCSLFIISQTRENIGVTFGEKHTRSGGKALDFYAEQIVWLAQTGKLSRVINKMARVYGVSIKAKVKKNKVGLPYREAEFDIKFSYGIDDLAASVKFLQKVGKLNMVQVGMTDRAVPDFIQKLHSLDHDAVAGWRKRLTEAVRVCWNDIEKAFLPPRSKYSNLG